MVFHWFGEGEARREILREEFYGVFGHGWIVLCLWVECVFEWTIEGRKEVDI